MEPSLSHRDIILENPQPSGHQGNIEPDDRNSSDSDSAFQGSIGDESYTTSVSSSVRNYKYEVKQPSSMIWMYPHALFD